MRKRKSVSSIYTCLLENSTYKVDPCCSSDQWKEIEESNRLGKTRDLFKKIRDTKGVFDAKMGTIKETIWT